MTPNFLDVAAHAHPGDMIVNKADDKIPIVLLIDTSESMAGDSFDRINEGIQLFKDKILNDAKLIRMVEIALISFNDTVEIIYPFSSIKDFNPSPPIAPGQTSMRGHGILTAIDRISSRKKEFKAEGVDYYRPWIFMITAGAATDLYFINSEKSQNVELLNQVISAVNEGEKNKHFEFFPVAMGNAVDIKQLEAIASNYPPVHLKRDKWNEMFSWIVDSMPPRSSIIPSWADTQRDCQISFSSNFV